MKFFWCSVYLLVALAVTPLWAAGPDSQYVSIYHLIQEGDTLRNQEKYDAAALKFREARVRLKQLQSDYSDWNPSVVRFRLKYLDKQVAALESETPVEQQGLDQIENKIEAAGVSREALEGLKTRIISLEQEKNHLEARLTEALKAQPATIDPRELEKADARIQELLKSRELLAAELKSAEGQIQNLELQIPDENAMEDARQKIEDQDNQLALLKMEKEALQHRLQQIVQERSQTPTQPVPQDEVPTVQLESENEEQQARLALLEAANQIKQQQEELERLKKSQEGLEFQVVNLTEANQRLEAEKEALQAEVAQLTQRLNSQTDLSKFTAQIAQIRTELESAKNENASLRRENESLEKQVDELTSTQIQQALEVEKAPEVPSQEVQELRVQLQTLKTQLNEANEKLAQKGKRKDRSKVVSLNNEIVLLRSRLEVLEAQKVPYTDEELALFAAQAPSSDPVEEAANVARRSSNSGIRSLPAGAGRILMQAQQAKSRGDLETAEDRYQQILQLDQDNVYVLSQIAGVQLDQDKLEEAEATIAQALAIDPQDNISQTTRGLIKFQQKDYDTALEIFSQVVKSNPDDAVAQTFLGVTLGHQGLRGPAEVALRKAIQLSPDNPMAHYNLAIAYAMQEPPFLQLARLHYNKALTEGFERNEAVEKRLELLENSVPGASGN